MLPVLFSIGNIPISSFGLLLGIGFIYSTFLVWRQARAWELNEEKILDLTLLTFFGGLIGSRLYFIVEHLDFFDSLSKMVLITKYPGYSFWGAFLGGWLALYLFVRRFKMDFWIVADIAAIGFLGGLIWGNFGCFLGGCGAGVPSQLLGVNMAGLVGKRFPIQAVEGLIFIYLMYKIWPLAIKFHSAGKVASTVLVYIGATKFITEFFRVSSNVFFPLILILLGFSLSYKISKRNIISDVRTLPRNAIKLLTDRGYSKMVLKSLSQNWYNLFKINFKDRKIKWSIKLNKQLRRFRVNPHPRDFK